MIVIFGLVILVAAVIVGVAGVLTNGGQAHAVTHFAVFGYHVTGSTGTLFLYGIVIGAVAMAGLSMLLAGARRTSRRGREARRGLAQSRRETAPSAQTATTWPASATPPAPTPLARRAATARRARVVTIRDRVITVRPLRGTGLPGRHGWGGHGHAG